MRAKWFNEAQLSLFNKDLNNNIDKLNIPAVLPLLTTNELKNPNKDRYNQLLAMDDYKTTPEYSSIAQLMTNGKTLRNAASKSADKLRSNLNLFQIKQSSDSNSFTKMYPKELPISKEMTQKDDLNSVWRNCLFLKSGCLPSKNLDEIRSSVYSKRIIDVN